MAIVNVNDPKQVNNVDPKVSPIPVDPDINYYKKEVEKTRLQRELKQERKIADEIDSPPQAPEPIFKVTGGVNLGTIDLQEQQRQARAEAEQSRREAQARIEKAEQSAMEAREALNRANLEHLQANLTAQIAQLQAAVQSGGKRDIFSELESVENIASKLGYAKNNGNNSQTDSFHSQLELKRLEQELKREDRKFALEMKRDERMWQVELRKLEMQKQETESKLAAEQQRWQAIAAIPEQIGGAWAKGMLERGGGGIGGAAPAPAPLRQTPANPTKPRGIEAVENEAGQIDCPVCNSPVGVGPTATKAVCASCGQTFIIKRIPAPAAGQVEAPAQ